MSDEKITGDTASRYLHDDRDGAPDHANQKPFTPGEMTQGIILYQFLAPYFEDEGRGLVLADGRAVAWLVRLLLTARGRKLFNRRFRGNEAIERPTFHAYTIPPGVAGHDADAVRAGRALLKWSRERLALESGVFPLTIMNVETGKSGGLPETWQKLKGALKHAGVMFAADGVRLAPRVKDDARDEGGPDVDEPDVDEPI